MSELDNTRKQFAALSDQTRLRLFALCARSEYSVSDLMRVLDQSQPRISRHLKLLTEAGLLERFRDGHFVFYRAPRHGQSAATVRQLEALLPQSSAELVLDRERAQQQTDARVSRKTPSMREFNQALMEFAIARPPGRLLDMGSGTGRVLTVLGARVSEAIGIERDNRRRQESRSKLRAADLRTCSVRQGDVTLLPFANDEFDTVVVDDVLGGDADPVRVLAEACRVVKSDGRVLVIIGIGEVESLEQCRSQLLAWSADRLTFSQPRAVPAEHPEYFLVTAVPARASREVA